MNFPMENPIFQFIYWVLNTPGVGGIAVLVLATSLLSTFALILRWIALGGQADEPEQYTFPTSTLLGHGHHDDR